MLDGEGGNKKSSSKLGAATGVGRDSSSDVLAGVGKQASGSKRTLTRDRSKDLDESWGSLQLQAEQMLGTDIEDETFGGGGHQVN